MIGYVAAVGLFAETMLYRANLKKLTTEYLPIVHEKCSFRPIDFN